MSRHPQFSLLLYSAAVQWAWLHCSMSTSMKWNTNNSNNVPTTGRPQTKVLLNNGTFYDGYTHKSPSTSKVSKTANATSRTKPMKALPPPYNPQINPSTSGIPCPGTPRDRRQAGQAAGQCSPRPSRAKSIDASNKKQVNEVFPQVKTHSKFDKNASVSDRTPNDLQTTHASRNSQPALQAQQYDRQSQSREQPKTRLKRSQSFHQSGSRGYHGEDTSWNAATSKPTTSSFPVSGLSPKSQVSQTQLRISGATPTPDHTPITTTTVTTTNEPENQSNESRSSPRSGTGSKAGYSPSLARRSSVSNTSHETKRGTSPSYNSSLAVAVFPKSGGQVGISNLGNTCFMNSMLQCLGQTGEMARIFLEMGSTPSPGLVRAYCELMQQMWRGDNTSYHSYATSLYPRMLKDAFSQKNPQFSGFDQHDSQEFMRFLVSGLHEELKRPLKHKPDIPQDNDPVKWWHWYQDLESSSLLDVFVGQLCSSLTCLHCRQCSLTFDPFWELSVSLPKHSSYHSVSSSYSFSRGAAYTDSSSAAVRLEECLDVFTREERLDGDERPYCDKCKNQQPSVKKMSIQRLPQVLIIHLKRFSGYGRRSKLDTSVLIPHTLNVSEYVTKPDSPSEEYELYAVSNHSGTVYFGHYTAWCKHYSTHKWYCYNDSQVSPVRVPTPTFPSSTAYVLFYRCVNKKNKVSVI